MCEGSGKKYTHAKLHVETGVFKISVNNYSTNNCICDATKSIKISASAFFPSLNSMNDNNVFSPLHF